MRIRRCGRAHGVEFWPVAGNTQDVAQSPEMRKLMEKGNFIAIMSQMRKGAKKNALAFAQGGLAACEGMDLIIAGLGGMFIGVALAEKLNIQFMQAHYIPFSPTRAYPSAVFPDWRVHGEFFESRVLSAGAADDVARISIGGYIARQQVWVCQTVVLGTSYCDDRFTQNPILYGDSPAVIPPPADWNEKIQVTGYWFLDPVEDWIPPADLLRFLQEGGRRFLHRVWKHEHAQS